MSNKDNYNKRRRDKLRKAGYCINGRSHGKPKKGRKCKRCLEVHQGKAVILNKKRREARAKGLCGTCSSRKPEPGKATCEPCLDGHRQSKLRMVAAANWCVKCQGAGFHRRDCPTRGGTYWLLLPRSR